MRGSWLAFLLVFSAAEGSSLVVETPSSQSSEPSPAILRTPGESTSGTPLSPAEKRMQGRWQGYDRRQGFKTWSLDVEGRRFRADGSGEWYEGRLEVSEDRQPGWMDFVIETCLCSYAGGTSEAVFGWNGAALIVAAAAPGNPRPDRLDAGGALRFVPAGGD